MQVFMSVSSFSVPKCNDSCVSNQQICCAIHIFVIAILTTVPWRVDSFSILSSLYGLFSMGVTTHTCNPLEMVDYCTTVGDEIKKTYDLLSMESWAASKEALSPVWVSSQRPLAQSVASVTSVANDSGDYEMILGDMHRSPGICLTAEENLS